MKEHVNATHLFRTTNENVPHTKKVVLVAGSISRVEIGGGERRNAVQIG